MGEKIADDLKEAIGCWFMQDLTGHSGAFLFHFGGDEKLPGGGGILIRQWYDLICFKRLIQLVNGYLMSSPVAKVKEPMQPGCLAWVIEEGGCGCLSQIF